MSTKSEVHSMLSNLRRAVCALLCCCLLFPCLGLAEQDASGLRFDLAFQMDASAFSQEQHTMVQGFADLLNILTLKGTLESSFTGCFDLNTELLLGGIEDTRTSLHVFGTESAWNIGSNLLGDETLLVNLVAVLEFSMKAYFHLDIPLQRLALLISPYVHTNALNSMTSAWRRVMLADTGARTISRKQALALATEMAEVSASDSAFQYWVQALALESGYDEVITQELANLPAWVESFISSKGIAVTFSGATETWRTGQTTLFTRTVEDTVTAWSLTLPPTASGYTISALYTGQPNGDHLLQLSITDESSAAVLSGCLQATGITSREDGLVLASAFSFQADLTGMAVEDGIHLLLEGQQENGYVTISVLNAQTRQPQLTITGTVQAYTPDQAPDYTSAQLSNAFNLLSMNDVTLTELMGSISAPLAQGVLPLLVHMPASSIQSILDLLEGHRVLDLLLNGGASSEEEYFD